MNKGKVNKIQIQTDNQESKWSDRMATPGEGQFHFEHMGEMQSAVRWLDIF